MNKINIRKKLLFLFIGILLIYISVEIISCIGLFILSKKYNVTYNPADGLSNWHAGIIRKLLNDKSSYIKFSPELGWTIRQSAKNEWYTANSQGFRGVREYSFIPPAGKFRIMVCGDGFVHCNDVKNDQTWPGLLEQMNSEWEVLNFGVWGHALDQVYLRYLNEASSYKSNIVLIGFGSNNIFRLVNTYRPFIFQYTGLPLTKPRFRIENGKLQLIANPIRSLEDYKTLLDRPDEIIPGLGVNDYYYKYRYKSHVLDISPTVKLLKIISDKMSKDYEHVLIFDDDCAKIPEALDIMKNLLDTFHEQVIKDGSIPVFCIFPIKRDIIRYRTKKSKRYSCLLTHFEDKGYRYIDLMGAFDKLGEDFNIDDLYIHFYTVIGNQLVADYLNESLHSIANEIRDMKIP
jgi:hypothetical protein